MSSENQKSKKHGSCSSVTAEVNTCRDLKPSPQTQADLGWLMGTEGRVTSLSNTVMASPFEMQPQLTEENSAHAMCLQESQDM